MSQITYSEQTHFDTERIRVYLDGIAPNLANKAILAIIEAVDVLRNFSEISPFCLDEVIIAAIRHSKESGYKI